MSPAAFSFFRGLTCSLQDGCEIPRGAKFLLEVRHPPPLCLPSLGPTLVSGSGSSGPGAFKGAVSLRNWLISQGTEEPEAPCLCRCPQRPLPSGLRLSPLPGTPRPGIAWYLAAGTGSGGGRCAHETVCRDPGQVTQEGRAGRAGLSAS